MGDDAKMEEFDVVVLGTGLKECVLSGLMSSAAKKKVLHIDRNPFYGGESASLNMDQLWTKFNGGSEEKAPESLGRSRDYCIDLCPKFIMACGDLVKILLLTNVKDYLEFKSVPGSYVVKKGKIHKVPSNAKEALASGLMGMFEKRRYRSFLQFCADYESSKPLEKGKPDVKNMTSAQLYTHFSLSPDTQNFTGHALALYTDDEYINGPAEDFVERVKLYAFSVQKYGNSPYIYPKWGLGGLPEGFSRRCAVHGGTFMLNMGNLDPFVEKIHFNDDGKVEGITLGEEVAKSYEIPNTFIKCKQIIADPSYFKDTSRVKKTGQVLHCIAIFNEPVPNTGNADACQIIIPAAQIAGRKSDIYVCNLSYHHAIAPTGKYVAIISANVETSNPETEINCAFDFLPKNIEQKWTWVSDSYEPTGNGSGDNCFITTTYDATTHFQTCSSEILAMYKAVTGEELNLDLDEAQE